MTQVIDNGATQAVTKSLKRFLTVREGARRFHREEIGHDVDPTFCFADFLTCAANASGKAPGAKDAINRLYKVYNQGVLKAALGEGSGITGGYLIPMEFRDDLSGDIADQAIFRPRALVIPMATKTVNLYWPDATTSTGTAGLAPFFGGMQLKWVTGTGVSGNETEPTFRMLTLTTWNLGGYLVISRPLTDDGLSIESFLRRIFAGSIAWYEDYFFLQGNGVGEPTGVINAGGSVKVSRSSPSSFVAADAQKMLASFHGPHGGLWAVSVTTATRFPLFPGWIPNGPMELYGYPIFRTMKQPQLGTQGDVVLVDPSLYVIGDRQLISVEYSADSPTAFLNNQGVWRVFHRVDGQPLLNAPITVPDGNSNTVSTSVVLV